MDIRSRSRQDAGWDCWLIVGAGYSVAYGCLADGGGLKQGQVVDRSVSVSTSVKSASPVNSAIMHHGNAHRGNAEGAQPQSPGMA